MVQQNGEDGLQNYLIVFEQYGKAIHLIFLTIRPFRSESFNPYSGDEPSYSSFKWAIQHILQKVPNKFYADFANVPLEDKVETFVTIFSALGVAVLDDINRSKMFEDIQVPSFDLGQTEYLANFDNTALRASKVRTEDQEHEFIKTHIERDFNLSPSFSSIAATVLSKPLKPFFPNMSPKVGAHREDKRDGFLQGAEAWSGFKDAIVNVTGPTEKFTKCNAQWGNFSQIYYVNYFNLFNAVNFRNNFREQNRTQSFRDLLHMVKWSLEWPYDMFYNCYWGSVTIYDNYYTHEFPHWLNWKNKSDGSYVKYGTYG